MSFWDVFCMIGDNIRRCFDIMKSIIIFKPGEYFDFAVSLFDISLGLFSSFILCSLFLDYFIISGDDDYIHSFDDNIFEEDFD